MRRSLVLNARRGGSFQPPRSNREMQVEELKGRKKKEEVRAFTVRKTCAVTGKKEEWVASTASQRTEVGEAAEEKPGRRVKKGKRVKKVKKVKKRATADDDGDEIQSSPSRVEPGAGMGTHRKGGGQKPSEELQDDLPEQGDRPEDAWPELPLLEMPEEVARQQETSGDLLLLVGEEELPWLPLCYPIVLKRAENRWRWKSPADVRMTANPKRVEQQQKEEGERVAMFPMKERLRIGWAKGGIAREEDIRTAIKRRLEEFRRRNQDSSMRHDPRPLSSSLLCHCQLTRF